jgi:hypothetical protein
VKETAPRYEKLPVPYIPKSPWADMTYEELREMRGCNKWVNVDRHLEEEKALMRMVKVASFPTHKNLFLAFVTFWEQSTHQWP